MKNFIIFIFLLLNILYAQGEKAVDPYKKIDYFVLDNGLKVYLLSDPRAVNTKIIAKFNVGWDIEDEKTFGLSHLVEHLVFRDQRVPYHDYLDYMKEEGASFVNGYTSRYKTQYIATIESKKSYWIAETFAKMLFDKNVTDEDLENERGALQVEIGDTQWYDGLIEKLSLLGKLIPPHEDIYTDHFGLSRLKELPSLQTEKENNKKFTLSQVMKHYRTYYYPKNMTLKIAGNFDTDKMETLVKKYYGAVHREGTQRTHRPPRDAALNHKGYYEFHEGVGENSGYIGTKFLLDDYQKYIILDSFMEYTAMKIQQQLRNEKGKSYTISSYDFGTRGAGIITIAFDGLREDFEKNIYFVQQTLDKYIKHLDNSTIQKALKEYKKKFTSVEYDSDSLMRLINQAEGIRSVYKIEDKSIYDLFVSIKPEQYKRVITETFTPQNRYAYIGRDYYFFAYDAAIISLLFLIGLIWLYFKFSHLVFKKRGVDYKKREIVLSRRLSNRFLGFVYFIVTLYVSALLYHWLEYLLLKYFMNDSLYLQTFDVPYGYYLTMFVGILEILFFFAFYTIFVHYFSRIDVTEKRMYILGSKPRTIEKEEIETMEVSPWSIDKIFNITGVAFFFWKPLLKVVLKSGKVLYLRAGNAQELYEDLSQKWLHA